MKQYSCGTFPFVFLHSINAKLFVFIHGDKYSAEYLSVWELQLRWTKRKTVFAKQIDQTSSLFCPLVSDLSVWFFSDGVSVAFENLWNEADAEAACCTWVTLPSAPPSLRPLGCSPQIYRPGHIFFYGIFKTCEANLRRCYSRHKVELRPYVKPKQGNIWENISLFRKEENRNVKSDYTL